MAVFQFLSCQLWSFTFFYKLKPEEFQPSYRWFPATERSRAVSIAMAGFTLGNAVGLTLTPILMSQGGGIFGPFVIFGLSGFLWLLVWVSAVSNSPDRHSQISKRELKYILSGQTNSYKVNDKEKGKVMPPFGRLLSKMPTWALIVANAMHSWVCGKNFHGGLLI